MCDGTAVQHEGLILFGIHARQSLTVQGATACCEAAAAACGRHPSSFAHGPRGCRADAGDGLSDRRGTSALLLWEALVLVRLMLSDKWRPRPQCPHLLCSFVAERRGASSSG